jgi:hypothetical protein
MSSKGELGSKPAKKKRKSDRRSSRRNRRKWTSAVLRPRSTAKREHRKV